MKAGPIFQDLDGLIKIDQYKDFSITFNKDKFIEKGVTSYAFFIVAKNDYEIRAFFRVDIKVILKVEKKEMVELDLEALARMEAERQRLIEELLERERRKKLQNNTFTYEVSKVDFQGFFNVKFQKKMVDQDKGFNTSTINNETVKI